ncbi:hypothetical protein CIK06_10625 [Plantactinospora sp. KBS50]|nr:hypothetical protein CIK06_10625 [Plantactinospora sp. KBS50]
MYLAWHRFPPPAAATSALAVIAGTATAARLGNRTRSGSPYIVLLQRATLLVQRAGTHRRYTFTHEKVVMARQDGVRLVAFPWHCTGQGSVSPTVAPLDATHTALHSGYPEEDGSYQRWIYFGKAIPRGQSSRAGLVTVMEDDVLSMLRFFRAGARPHRVVQLEVTLVFPKDEEPAEVHGFEWNEKKPQSGGTHTQLAIVRNLDTTTNRVSHALRVRHPKRHLRYGFRWT